MILISTLDSVSGLDTKPASFDFETSDGLNEASIETFKVNVRKPELQLYDGRVKLAVFPLTQTPLRPENLLVRSTDGRDVNYQVCTDAKFNLFQELSFSIYNILSLLSYFIRNAT